MVCRNICERIHSEKIIFGISNYSLGQKYCRRCEVYMYSESAFCPCCGMQLRLTPSNRKHKEILRKRKLLMQNGRWLMD
jgi:rRNA maturation endonuclease Nob1